MVSDLNHNVGKASATTESRGSRACTLPRRYSISIGVTRETPWKRGGGLATSPQGLELAKKKRGIEEVQKKPIQLSAMKKVS